MERGHIICMILHFYEILFNLTDNVWGKNWNHKEEMSRTGSRLNKEFVFHPEVTTFLGPFYLI
jgi:hypothetical protein